MSFFGKKCTCKSFIMQLNHTMILWQPTMKQLPFFQCSILPYALFFVSGWFLDAFVGWHRGSLVVAQYSIYSNSLQGSWALFLPSSSFNTVVKSAKVTSLASTTLCSTSTEASPSTLACFLYCLVINVETETDFSLVQTLQMTAGTVKVQLNHSRNL